MKKFVEEIHKAPYNLALAPKDKNNKLMDKHFISANELLEDSFRLGNMIYRSGFRPHFIIGVWRGGTPVGIAVQEYLAFRGIDTDHISIRTSSYTEIGQQEKIVKVHGMQYVIDNINADDSLLLVDDVFDSGRSIIAILDELESKTRRNLPNTIKVATPWFKPTKNITDITPDYYLHETESWLVFPHELVGLTPEEIQAGKHQLADDVKKDFNTP
jgi:hypoxanthine phosphoribosyltransferase